MKNLALVTILFFVACAPRYNYLGDEYSPNLSEVDVYYDIGDVSKDFRVMGILTADSSQAIEKSPNKIRDQMIEKAANKGADGILFINVYGALDGSNNSIIESKLLKYK